MTREELIRSAEICKNNTTCAGCVFEKENMDFACVRALLWEAVEMLKGEERNDP